MLLMRTKTLFALIGCALAAASLRVHVRRGRRHCDARSERHRTAPPRFRTLRRSINPSSVANADAAESEPDMPACSTSCSRSRDRPGCRAEAARRTAADAVQIWPLVAEQFRASLAYHERLAAKTKLHESRPRVDRCGNVAEPHAIETGYDSTHEVAHAVSRAKRCSDGELAAVRADRHARRSAQCGCRRRIERSHGEVDAVFNARCNPAVCTETTSTRAGRICCATNQSIRFQPSGANAASRCKRRCRDSVRHDRRAVCRQRCERNRTPVE